MRLWFASVAFVVVVLDQLTKLLIVRSLAVGESRPVIDGVLHITHVRNPGAAFGILRGYGGVLALAAIVGIAVFAVIIMRHPPPLLGVAAAAIAGGALGNLIDRATRGSVVDFVDLRVWPSFNVADAAISVGAVLFLVAGFRDQPDAEETDTGGDADPDR